MNLVQINERLKDLPMQVIQQYANGMNPEVPPYLALGELQRREISQKQMATAQGAQQGQQPSIKEQVEQKAGLMALQQQQMQQAQQQQPRGPMPVPAGVPQPQMQPQAPQAMMARGGLAGIPVRRDMFEYAGGGIIAFANTGEVEDPRRERKEGESFSDFRKRMFDLDLQLQRERNASERSGREAERQKLLAERGNEVIPPSPFMERPPLPAPTESPANVTAETMARVGPMKAPPFKHPLAANSGLPEALKNITSPPPVVEKNPAAPRPTNLRPAATPPVAPPAQAAEQPSTSPFLAEAATMARDKPVAPTPEGVIAEQKKLLPAGMQEEAMQKMFADQRARAEARQAAYDKSKPSGLDDLIRVFGQAGQYKGMSGMGPAYTANQDRRRAEDLAMQKQQDELMTAIEGRQYGADEKMFGARKEAMSAANKSFQDRLMTNTKSLADLAGVDQRRMDEAAQRLTQVELEKMRSATQNRSLNEKLRFEADFLSLKAKARALEAKGEPAEAAKFEARANDMLSIRSGGSATANVGAERNDISRKRLQIQTWEKIRDSSSDSAAIKEAEGKILQLARDIAKIESGTGGGAAPKIGDEQDGFRFKGGNPAVQSNWEKVK